MPDPVGVAVVRGPLEDIHERGRQTSGRLGGSAPAASAPECYVVSWSVTDRAPSGPAVCAADRGGTRSTGAVLATIPAQSRVPTARSSVLPRLLITAAFRLSGGAEQRLREDAPSRFLPAADRPGQPRPGQPGPGDAAADPWCIWACPVSRCRQARHHGTRAARHHRPQERSGCGTDPGPVPGSARAALSWTADGRTLALITSGGPPDSGSGCWTPQRRAGGLLASRRLVVPTAHRPGQLVGQLLAPGHDQRRWPGHHRRHPDRHAGRGPTSSENSYLLGRRRAHSCARSTTYWPAAVAGPVAARQHSC